MRMTIGRWQVDTALDELSLDGRRVKLEPRTMRILATLAQTPGQLVTADALFDAVWPGLVVTPNSLHQGIAELRRILRADQSVTEFIATVPRKGYRLTAPVVIGDATAASTGKATEELPAGDQAAAPTTDRAGPILGPRSVAVLPFRVRGLPERYDFLGDALLDDLIAELSRQPLLTAIARGTMLTYARRDVDPKRLTRELGVRFVVDGRIDCHGRTLQVAARLVDAPAGVQVWADAIDLALDDWPTMGRLVIGRLARGLNLEVTDGSAREDDAPGDARSLARQTALRAWSELYCRPQSRATNERAMRWAEEALAADDSLAIAWNALAYCEWRAAQHGWLPDGFQSLVARALDHVQRALELAPRDPDAHYTLGLVTYIRCESVRAEAVLRNCLALSPSYAPAHALLGVVRSQLGHPEEAEGLVGRAFALSPHEPLRAIWHWVLANAALQLDDNAAALAHAQRGMAVNSDYATNYVAAAAAAWRIGRRDLAADYIRVLQGSNAFASIPAVIEHLPTASTPGHGPRLLADLAAAGLSPGKG